MARTTATTLGLSTEALTVGYEQRISSENLNVRIPDGSFTVIVGPDAGGKSTLLRAMARLIKPRSGPCPGNRRNCSIADRDDVFQPGDGGVLGNKELVRVAGLPARGRSDDPVDCAGSSRQRRRFVPASCR
ncbi:energy-coupling factor transporter ATP-binding protein EcfA2 [Arthrobacter sp. UYCu712]